MIRNRIIVRLTSLTALILVAPLCAGTSPALAGEVECSQNSSTYHSQSSCQNFSSMNAARVAKSNSWLQAYAELRPFKKRLFKPAAILVAKFRRRALKRLIQFSPEDAYSLSLSPQFRQGLPKSVLKHFETRIHATGDIYQSITESFPEAPNKSLQENLTDAVNTAEPWSELSWSVRINDQTRQAFVYGIRTQHQTKFDTPIHGVALDDVMAISDSPLYLYDEFEKSELGYKPDEIVATDGELPIRIPDIRYFTELEQKLIDRLLQLGPLNAPFHPNEWTTGNKRVLVFRITFSGDDTETPYTDGEIGIWFSGAQQFFSNNSQGLTTLDPLIVSAPVPVRTADSYRNVSSRRVAHEILMENAMTSIRVHAGLDPDDFDRVVIMAPQLFDDDPQTGQAQRNGKAVVITGYHSRLDRVITHELGHTFGFPHSQFWRPFVGSEPVGPGESLLYGDQWDMMGAPLSEDLLATPQRLHFNAFFKAIAGWLPREEVADGTMGGDFRLYAHDGVDTPNLTRAIFVEAGDGWVYWLGRRSQFPENVSIANGIEIRRVPDHTLGDFVPVELLDLDNGISPGGGSEFHSLRERLSFVDAPNGIEIRVITIADDELGREFVRVFITRT